jgi:Putative bacterial sensory transduction regulator
MDITPDLVDEYFERYGWSFTRESDDTWITGVRTSVSAFRIMVRITEHWVFFIINPLVVAPSRDDHRLRVYYHALRYNLDMNFAKLGVDADGDIFMAIELPSENFVYSHFVDALDGLSHHASMIYTELFSLAHNGENVSGRYDDELDEDEETMPDFPLLDFPQLGSRDEEPEAEDDILIAGRRLKVTYDESGSAQFDLEEDDSPDDPPKPEADKPKDEA